MLQFLFSPTKQFTYESGKLLDGGKIYVYIKDTTNLATLYDVDGDYTTNPILLDANGRASVKADDEFEYRLEIYTNNDVLLYTCNAFCDGGTGSSGLTVVRHDDTLSGNGTSEFKLGVISIPLAVDETMTAYSAIVEEQESLVLGVNGDWFTDTFGSALNTKVDWSSFSACCSAVKGGLDNKLDISSFDLSNYYNKQETNNLLDQRVDRNEFTQTINYIDQTKQDKLTFDYNENSAISAINGSALAGQGGGEGSCPWISGGKEIAEAQTLTSNMLFQALSSFTLSGDHNHFISMKGGIYRFPNEWELASGIAITNYFMPQSSFSSYSSTVANEFSTLYGQDSYLSGRIDNLQNNKLDSSAFDAYTANDETYLLVGGNKIGISSNSATQETTIYFTGTNGDEEVNNVVRNFSANGTWLTSHQSLADYATKQWVEDKGYITGVDLTPYQEKNGMTAYQPVSSMTGYYPMTGNPSGFLTAVDLTPYLTTADANTISSTLSGAITAISSEVPQLSAGEGIDISTVGGKTVITNNISAGDNISLVYDSETNKIRIDCELTGDVGHTYTGVAPIQVNNTTDEISISGESLSAGPGIDMFASGGYIVISANDQSNCHCIKFTNTLTSVNLENYSAYDKVTVVNAQQYGNDCELHWDGNTKVFPSGLYCELVRGTKNDNSDKWSFMTSGWTNDGWWDYN